MNVFSRIHTDSAETDSTTFLRTKLLLTIALLSNYLMFIRNRSRQPLPLNHSTLQRLWIDHYLLMCDPSLQCLSNLKFSLEKRIILLLLRETLTHLCLGLRKETHGQRSIILKLWNCRRNKSRKLRKRLKRERNFKIV